MLNYFKSSEILAQSNSVGVNLTESIKTCPQIIIKFNVLLNFDCSIKPFAVLPYIKKIIRTNGELMNRTNDKYQL